MSEDLYSILELTKGADASEIRKQYLKLSRIYHPDKVSVDKQEASGEKFKKISQAYEILSDESKRSFYDQTGQLPGEGGGGGGGVGSPFGFPGGFGGGIPFDMNGLFGMFQGPRGGGQKGRKSGKAPSRKTQIPLTVKDFYMGRTIQIRLERQRFCNACKGEGAVSVKSCGDCNGLGVKQQIVQMGPMIINNTGPCMNCKGSGKLKGDTCTPCGGSKFTKQDRMLDLQIKKGMKSGDTIVFPGESSNIEEFTEPGDVCIELVSADEEHGWERVGDNLRRRISLTLGEALCGTHVKLDGHPGYESGLYVQIPAGVQNRQEITVEGCGMPRTSLSGFGDCIFSMTVVPTKEERLVLEAQKKVLSDLFSISKGLVSEEHIEGIPILQAKAFQY